MIKLLRKVIEPMVLIASELPKFGEGVKKREIFNFQENILSRTRFSEVFRISKRPIILNLVKAQFSIQMQRTTINVLPDFS